jgi:hypothetical protein
MKITLEPTQFVFTPSLNKIDFSNMIGAFKPYRLLAVTNVTTGKLIYSVASQPAGYNGSFSTTIYPDDTLTYVSSNAGQSASDIIEVLYDSDTQPQLISGTTSSYILETGGNTIGGVADPSGGGYKLKTASSTLAADGTPILSTVDPMTGGDGLNMHLQSSSYGGQIGNPIPLPNNNNALSVGFLNNNVLVSPAMDPVSNQLIVQSAGVALQNVNLTEVNGSTISLGSNTMANSLPVTLATDQAIKTVSQDILGVAIGGNRNNQIEIAFNTAPGATLITNTFTGSGAVSITNGHSIYSTGTVASSSARAVSIQETVYRPLHETYSAFTAAFLNPQALCQSRIGLFDTNNGFAIGFDGALFSIFVRSGGVESATDQASFNTDTLNGSAGSKFTRNGVPEALNTTVSNLFRIRFAWLGSANIYFEVFSPDGEWVLFHNIRQPNSAYNPSIQDPNLPMTLELVKTGGTINSSIATACWGAGTTSAYSPITDTLNDKSLAALTRSVITGQTTGGGGGYVNVKVNPSGSLVVENTQSGTASNNIAQYGGVATTLGQKNSGNSIPVVLASDQSAFPVTTENYITGQQANNATPANGTPGLGTNLLNAAGGTTSTDCTGYRTASVQVVSTAISTAINFEYSNDNTNWVNFAVFRPDSVSPNAITGDIVTIAGLTATIYSFPIFARYIRLRLRTAPSLGNTIQAYTRLSTMAWSPTVVNAINGTAANLNATVSGSLTGVTTVSTVTTVGAVTSITNTVNTKVTAIKGQIVRNDYATTNVTTGAYVQLIASTTSAYTAVEVFDSSGQSMVLAIGAAGSEVQQFYIFPGGNGRVNVNIASAQRISVRAVSGNATTGELLINFYA